MKTQHLSPVQTPPKDPTSPMAAYTGIIEKTYTFENPEITTWTRRFEDHVVARSIFSDFEKTCPISFERACVVGTLWNHFSAFMPWFLCQAAAKMSTNEKRHYVIQTAFEELGMRDVREIHADMFWKAALKTGLTHERAEETSKIPGSSRPLDALRASLLSYNTDEEVLGILLGLEIPARENVETLFQSLAHTPALEEELSLDQFFSLHRQIEIEHVRLTVSNFVRFCKTPEQKERFLIGFRAGLDFWQAFWGTSARICNG